jgi:hydrogenase maturation protease HycI
MNFEEQLAAGLEGVVVVMGIGNPLRGDDAAGSLAARRILGSQGVCVIDAQDVPENYLLQVVNQHPDTIVLIDSVDLHSAPGSVAFLDRDQLAEYWPSTHRMPIRMLMEILDQETHARVIGIGIQPAHTEFLNPVSDAVAESLARVADILNGALARGRRATHGMPASSVESEVPA